MASSTKPGSGVNLDEEAEGGSRDTAGLISIPVTNSDAEATSLFVCCSPFEEKDIDSCNPYFPFSSLDSDTESGSLTDSEPDPYICPIDFFDRESYEVDAVDEFNLESDGIRTSGDFNIWGFYDPKEEEEKEIVLGLGVVSGPGSGSGSRSDHHSADSDGLGLRATSLDSDSDYEDGVFDFTYGDNEYVEIDSGQVEVETDVPPVWDSFFGEETVLADEELDWEEVQNAINWTRELVQGRTFSRPERGEEEYEELSSPSRISSRDDHENDLDWQVLLAVNNVVNFIEQAEGIIINPDDIDPNYYLYLANLDEYDETHHGYYDAILGQMFDNEAGIRGNPPAAKKVVEDLPVVELSMEELKKGNIVCAVCKDEMAVEEKVRRLPCRHCFHGDCIMPWLGIRNTCPVCRHELPTDDLEYENNRRPQRSDSTLTTGNLSGTNS